MPVLLNTQDADFEKNFTALLSAKREDSPDVDSSVARIIADVQQRGDAAVLDLTENMTGLRCALSSCKFPPQKLKPLVRRLERKSALPWNWPRRASPPITKGKNLKMPIGPIARALN